MALSDEKELKKEQLRKSFNPRDLPEIEDVDPSRFLGQERAISALNFGLGIKEDVFNIFLCGPAETGKTTLVKELLEDIVLKCGRKPKDWCYVGDFDDEKTSHWISFPQGQAKHFKKEIRDTIDGLLKSLKAEAELFKRAYEKGTENIKKFNEQAKKFELIAAFIESNGGVTFDLYYQDIDEGCYTKDFIVKGGGEMPPEKRDRILKNFNMFQEPFEKLTAAMKETEEYLKSVLDDKEKLRAIKEERIAEAFAGLKEKYRDNERVSEFLGKMENDVRKNIGLFDLSAPVKGFHAVQGICEGCRNLTREKCSIHSPKGVFARYEINIIIDNSATAGAPVVVKNISTYHDLFGKVNMEFEPPDKFRSDHTMITAGALHEANGGFLVLKTNDLLVQPLFLPLWQRLVHALKSGVIKMETIPSITGFESNVGTSLVPEPIPLEIRIILIGSDFHYHIMLGNDDIINFTRIFKVKAQMETRMPLNEANVKQTIGYIKYYCQKSNLIFPDKEALARIIEFSLETAESGEKMTLEISTIKELLKEANYYAGLDRREKISLGDIKRSLKEKERRLNLYEEGYSEYIGKNIIAIAVSGEEVGQINGLAVMSTGDHTFGKPARVTARVSMGKDGLMSIDREVEMSGEIHDKGVFILENYFLSVFGKEIPITFNASLSFEQNYGIIDGDSASSTELYALLSAFAETPIKQGIAVTGSVDQTGNVQPIGGVNYKIKGFYSVCKQKGLDGKQGVMIPKSNLGDLMLDEEIAEAVTDKKFHIWQVSRIEEGIEILTGIPFGGEDFNGDCIYKRVETKLKTMAEKARDFMEKEGKD